MKRRNTPIQDAVLSVLTKKRRAMSQDSIVKQLENNADRATVYRILNRFCDDNKVHKIVADDGKQYFAICVGCENVSHIENHFHFRCTQCESIECLPNIVQISIPNKYIVEQMNCVIVGVCKDCS